MYHFFVPQEQIGPEEIVITGMDVKHIGQVLRMKPGDQVLISNGADKEYRCRLKSLGAERIYAEILAEEKGESELSARLYLFQGLPKGDKMELIIQKAVELGVYQVLPVAAKRSVVRLEGKKEEAKVKRWNGIAQSAAKQSGRRIVPEVTHVLTLEQALVCAKKLHIRMLPYENARGMRRLQKLIGEVKPGMSIGVLIGPEGGFEETEVESAVQAGFCPVSLGRRILRTETAGITALAVLMYQLETQVDP